MSRKNRPETCIAVDVCPQARTRRQVTADFRARLAGGARLLPAGEERDDPDVLLEPGYLPRHAVSLFDVVYYLTDFLYEEGLNFFVGYVAIGKKIRPRIFYKDSSLIWRVASHMIRADGEDWIGKGDTRWIEDEHGEHLVSDEDTSNLPYEIQAAFDEVSRRRKPRRDDDALRLILRNAPLRRWWPYADFSSPRRRASALYGLNRNRPVARIIRPADPSSLHFAAGFAPDFRTGMIEETRSASRLYGGAISKYRVLSENKLIQYQFVASPTHVWVNPPQALTTEITSYGVRALHVPADEEIFIPGYEYHYYDYGVDPPQLESQIPAGWVGEQSEADPERADASRWIEALPVIKQFRRHVL